MNNNIARICIAGLLSAVPLALPARAADCECVKITASSSSDSGSCTVQESDTSFCSLSWRHAADSGPKDADESAKAEAQTQTFLSTREAGTFFSEAIDQSALKKLEASSPTTAIWSGAATYLERTHPKEYKKDLALASYVALLASSNAFESTSVRPVLLHYLSKYSEQVLSHLAGDSVDSQIVKTELGTIADLSTYGCLEIRHLRPSSADSVDVEDFIFRVGVSTVYAEGDACLRRR